MRRAVTNGSSAKEGQAAQHLSPVWGEGVRLSGAAGNRLTDFTSGIGVTSMGHAHSGAVKVQARAEAWLDEAEMFTGALEQTTAVSA